MKTMSGEIEREAVALNGPASDTGSILTAKKPKVAAHPFGRPPEFLGNRFVYAVISQRAHGLSIGINLNPDKICNYDCAYCEVNRSIPARDTFVDLNVMSAELENLLTMTRQGRLREYPYFQTVPDELLVLKAVALSGEGEPTLSPP